MSVQHDQSELRFTTADIERAAEDGVLSIDDAERLIRWGYDQRFGSEASAPRVEQRKGFNVVTVAYYFGAMMMITACAWFLGDKWDALGPHGIFTTSLAYALAAASIGWWIRKLGYEVGGGLLITVAVCLVPLLTYSAQAMLGLWPAEDPGQYSGFYPRIHGSWIVMELATIASALIVLRYVRFGFLTAPLAFAFWFLSMDVGSLILGESYLDGETRKWISVVVGAITLAVGYLLERDMRSTPESSTNDFSFWCYLFGMLAFWGGLTSMDGGSELNRAVYALINIGLVALAIRLKRTVFLVFGALGVHLYLGHLAYTVFEDSFLFPFVLGFLGLSLILLTVVVQRKLSHQAARSQGMDNLG